MKYSPSSLPHSAIEILESRIAPAALTTLAFFDQNGNAVTVTTTKGTIGDLQTATGLLPGAHATGALTLTLGAAFRGADITVLAGATATDGITTQVGLLDATGIDLGKVTIDGELDVLDAGDAISATPALKAITVGQWGNGGVADSTVVGGITSLKVLGDFDGAFLLVKGSASDVTHTPYTPGLTDPDGKIGTLFIGGSLIGTARENGGHIYATGDIGKLTVVGSVQGYVAPAVPAPLAPTLEPVTNDFNARIFSRGAITSATLGGISGGDADSSGQIVGVSGIVSITVNGSVQGGGGTDSGSIGGVGALGKVMVTGSLLGGGGTRSGTILGHTTIGSVSIGTGGKGGDIQGGSGFNSGAIGAGNNDTIAGLVQIGSVTVNGDIIGGDGQNSGDVVSQGTIKSVTAHSLIGGSDFESGSIGSSKGLGTILITGSILAGTGERSGLISTQPPPVERPRGSSTGGANAPIASVTVLGSIDASDSDTESGAGYQAGGILSSGQLGPVVVKGNVIGGGSTGTGRIASQRGITSVTIGGSLAGGEGDNSGTVFAQTSLGPVAIGDPTFQGVINGIRPAGTIGGFSGRGIIGGGGFESGTVIGGTLASINVYGNVQGDLGQESGAIETIGTGAAGKLGAVYIRGSIEGSGDGADGGDSSGTVFSNGDLTSVFVGGEVRGGGGDHSGAILSTGNMGPVTIGGGSGNFGPRDLVGGAGDTSGVVISKGKLASITIKGYLLGGDGASSGRIETQGSGALGNMGAVFIGGSLLATGGTAAVNSAQIASSGAIASVVIGDPADTNTEDGGSLTGGAATGSGQIVSALNLGPVKIKLDLQGGAGDESGKIISGGNLASLNVGSSAFGGSIIGGTGNYDTTTETANVQLGQVFARGTIGAVTVFGSVQGDPADSEGGDFAAQVRGLAIASVTVHGDVSGGTGAQSGGFFAASGNIGAVVIDNNLSGGSGYESGFVSAEGNIASVGIGGALLGGGGSASGYVAAGVNLGAVHAARSGNSSDTLRPHLSAGKAIASVTIDQSIYNTDILAGYNTNDVFTSAGGQIGLVTIGTSGGESAGFMQGTNIIAGSGVFSDIARPQTASAKTPLSKIAGVIVKNEIVNTSSPYDTYYIIADYLVSLKVGTKTFALKSGAQNDFYQPISLGEPNSDTLYGEIPSIG